MRKYKYKQLSKEEKNKVNEEYKKKYAKSDFESRLTRLLVYSIIGYVFSIFLIVYSIIRKEDMVSNLLIAIPLFIAATIFLIGRYYAKLMVLEKFVKKKLR